MKTFFNMAIYKYFAFAMETLKKKKDIMHPHKHVSYLNMLVMLIAIFVHFIKRTQIFNLLGN